MVRRKVGEDEVPANGRTGPVSWQPGEATTSAPPSAHEAPSPGHTARRVVDRLAPGAARPAARGVRAPGSRRSFSTVAVRNLLALAATITLLAAGLAFAGALMWPSTYAARAEILFPITQEQPSGSALREDRNLTTQLVLLQGRAVLGPIAAQQQRAVEDLQDDVSVQVVETSEIIQLEVTDRSQDAALQTAQQVVSAYVERSQSGQPALRQRLESELVASNTALIDAQAGLTAQQQQVTAGTATAETLVPLQTAVQAQRSRQLQLQAQLDAINLAPVAQLLTQPYPVGTVSPRPGFAAAAGGLVGLVMAAVLVAVVARSWSTKE